eukprot:1619898-Alexandrium_andersonii.AAC.1
MLIAELSAISLRTPDGYLAWAAEEDWSEACIVPLPRNLLPLAVARLYGVRDAYHVRAVACQAGL